MFVCMVCSTDNVLYTNRNRLLFCSILFHCLTNMLNALRQMNHVLTLRTQFIKKATQKEKWIASGFFLLTFMSSSYIINCRVQWNRNKLPILFVAEVPNRKWNSMPISTYCFTFSRNANVQDIYSILCTHVYIKLYTISQQDK